REILAFIQRADAALVEAGFINLEIGAVQRIRRQLLDREANRFGRSAKSPIREPRPLLLADRGGKQLGSSIEAEGSHGQGPLIFLVRTRLRNRERIARTHLAAPVHGTRHFRTAFNIGLFDRNATPEAPDDESGNLSSGSKINSFISMRCQGLQLAEQQKGEEHDQNPPADPHAGMAHAIAVAPKPAAEAAQKVNDHNDDEYRSERHGTLPEGDRQMTFRHPAP